MEDTKKATGIDTRFGRMGRVVTASVHCMDRSHRGHRKARSWTEPGYYKLLKACKGNDAKFAQAIVSITRKFSHGELVHG